MNRVAVIPARAGSKGVPNKNIADLCGKPMIVYSIEAALQSGLFDRVLVTTDSEEYAAISRAAGAEVVMRPPELATDTATSYDAIKHALEAAGAMDCDYFVLLQVTSPLRTAQDICDACALFDTREEGMEYVVSVKESDSPSHYTFVIDEDKTLKNFRFDLKRGRRQDFREYTLNGAIYIAEPATYIASHHFFGPTCKSFVMSAVNSVDVDSPIDLELARVLMQKRQNGEI